MRLGDFLFGLHAAPGAEVIHREVVRDPEEPRRERRRLPPEAADRLEHLEERLRREILGVVPVADAHVEVAVDAIEMEEVELLERSAIALLRALDERPDAPTARRDRGHRHLLRHHLRGMPRRALPVTQLPLNPTRPSREKRLT